MLCRVLWGWARPGEDWGALAGFSVGYAVGHEMRARSYNPTPRVGNESTTWKGKGIAERASTTSSLLGG